MFKHEAERAPLRADKDSSETDPRFLKKKPRETVTNALAHFISTYTCVDLEGEKEYIYEKMNECAGPNLRASMLDLRRRGGGRRRGGVSFCNSDTSTL